MAIVGYGDIGAACAKIAKNGFNMKVTGVKRRPDQVSDEHRSYCDEIVGNDQFDRIIAEADYVVGVLPKVAGQTDDFFNMTSTFSKMKNSSVFMNIGRGTTVNEDDLVKALNEGVISGAVLDVYKVEPLVKESGLWDCKNVLMTPHCADHDSGHLPRAMQTFVTNLNLYIETGTQNLVNVCDKKSGY
jgi:phosphoglycerate dehydrogenase-like enzyme